MRQGELLGLSAGRTSISSLWDNCGCPDASDSREPIHCERAKVEAISPNDQTTLVVYALSVLRHAMLKEGNIGSPVFCTKTGQFISKSNLTRQIFKPILVDANDQAVEVATERGNWNRLFCQMLRFQLLRHTHTRRHCLREVIRSRRYPSASAMRRSISP